jgi:hypothetical protein
MCKCVYVFQSFKHGAPTHDTGHVVCMLRCLHTCTHAHTQVLVCMCVCVYQSSEHWSPTWYWLWIVCALTSLNQSKKAQELWLLHTCYSCEWCEHALCSKACAHGYVRIGVKDDAHGPSVECPSHMRLHSLLRWACAHVFVCVQLCGANKCIPTHRHPHTHACPLYTQGISVALACVLERVLKGCWKTWMRFPERRA